MKLKELEKKLEGLQRLSSPSVQNEQYFTPPSIAASIVYDATMRGDVENRRVADLGCGIGTFAIAAMVMGATSAAGFDSDARSIELATGNALRMLPAERLSKTLFEVAEVEDVKGRYDTVFQNPPFGSQRRNADLPFIRKALEIGDTVYTIHLGRTREFLKEKFEELGARVEFEKAFIYEMPRMFHFHTKEKKGFELILFKVVKIQG